MKQRSAGTSPRLITGQKPRGPWNNQYATAISPDARKASGRVKSPSRISRPPYVSRIPPIPEKERRGGM